MGTANLILLGITLMLQGFLLVVLYRSRVFWQFPIFFAYNGGSVIATAVLLATNSNYRIYYYAFWTLEAVMTVLELLALHEVFRKVFFGFYVQFRWFRLLFPSAVILTLLFVLWAARYESPIRGSVLRNVILLGGLAVNFAQVGVSCLLIAIARTFHLRWRLAPLGILLGFTLAALGSILDYWAVSEFGTKVENFTVYIPPVVYILAIVVWLDTFFFRPEPGPGSLSAATMLQLAEDIRRDTMILKKIMEKFK